MCAHLGSTGPVIGKGQQTSLWGSLSSDSLRSAGVINPWFFAWHCSDDTGFGYYPWGQRMNYTGQTCAQFWGTDPNII